MGMTNDAAAEPPNDEGRMINEECGALGEGASPDILALGRGDG